MNLTKIKIAAPVSFAIFAMFFGAGNLIFPLLLGANAAGPLWLTMVGFLLAGVGVPLLGLFAVILYKGDYQEFFSSLGPIPAQIVIGILVLMLGVFTANPRCSLITYQTLAPYLPHFRGITVLFNLVFFSLVYVVSIKKNRILDVIGYVFSPIKLILLILLIIAAIITGHLQVTVSESKLLTLWHAVFVGYGTMDLLAAFFFCSLVYRHITIKVRQAPELKESDKLSLTAYACIIGAIWLGVIYGGFIVAANLFAPELQGLTADKLISTIAIAVFGKAAAFIICLMVSFACFVTAISLTAIAVDYIQRLLQTRKGYHQILLLILIVVFAISNIGFTMIMSLSMPILEILYPALLLFTISRIVHYAFNFRLNAVLFYVGLAAVIAYKSKAFFLS